ncbi:MAG: hypothetical protein INR71_05005 [Terriglobus roseus]|nr:hypothetical protein [Terriglobus roseus]
MGARAIQLVHHTTTAAPHHSPLTNALTPTEPPSVLLVPGMGMGMG